MKGIDVARQYVGLNESADKEKLMELFKAQAHDKDILIDPSKTSWCAAFMNATQRAAGGTGNGKLNAQSFLTYGEEVENFDDAEEGDIVIFHFPTDQDWQGHVTYFVKWNDDANVIMCLGGNQRNAVNIAAYSQDFIKKIRRGK